MGFSIGGNSLNIHRFAFIIAEEATNPKYPDADWLRER
jgi:hypothetical protein